MLTSNDSETVMNAAGALGTLVSTSLYLQKFELKFLGFSSDK